MTQCRVRWKGNGKRNSSNLDETSKTALARAMDTKSGEAFNRWAMRIKNAFFCTLPPVKLPLPHALAPS